MCPVAANSLLEETWKDLSFWRQIPKCNSERAAFTVLSLSYHDCVLSWPHLLDINLRTQRAVSGTMTLSHEERRKIHCNQKLILDLGACLALFPSPASCTREFLCLP